MLLRWLACCRAQWYEIERDARMMRTRNRPLPQGRVSPRHALAFALVTGLGGVGILYWQVTAGSAPSVLQQCLLWQLGRRSSKRAGFHR